ncbi:MAG: hypothetical protein V7K60_29625 [Nostoc sp.]
MGGLFTLYCTNTFSSVPRRSRFLITLLNKREKRTLAHTPIQSVAVEKGSTSKLLYRLTMRLFRLTMRLFRLTMRLFRLTMRLFRLTMRLFRLTMRLFRLTMRLF